MQLIKMYKIKRFSKLREKKMSLNPRNSWSNNNDMNNLPKGVIRHPNSKYSKYNAVWENPDVKGRPIIKYVFNDKLNKNILDDLAWIKENSPPMYNRVKKCIDDLRNSKYVTTDNDRLTKMNIDDESNLMYNWDTNTHWISIMSTKDYLLYSKDINDSYRLTYRIYKPIKVNLRWQCMVELDRCNNHKSNDKSYTRGKRRNSLWENSKRKGDANKVFSDNYFYYEKNKE